MKRILKQRAEKYAESTEYPEKVYFSRVVPDARYVYEKYFFKFLNTNIVAEAFATQKELNEFLESRGF